MPRYLTESLLGIIVLLMVTWGQVCFRSVKVTWEDFFSFILKPHFWNHFSMESRLRWRVDEAIAGSSPVARGQHIYPGKRPSHKKTQAGRTPVKMNIAASAEIITCRNSAYFGINRH